MSRRSCPESIHFLNEVTQCFQDVNLVTGHECVVLSTIPLWVWGQTNTNKACKYTILFFYKDTTKGSLRQNWNIFVIFNPMRPRQTTMKKKENVKEVMLGNGSPTFGKI